MALGVSWWTRIRIGLGIVGAAFGVFWIILRQTLRRGEAEGAARERYEADNEAVRRAEEAGDADWIKRDLLRRAQGRNGDGRKR